LHILLAVRRTRASTGLLIQDSRATSIDAPGNSGGGGGGTQKWGLKKKLFARLQFGRPRARGGGGGVEYESRCLNTHWHCGNSTHTAVRMRTAPDVLVSGNGVLTLVSKFLDCILYVKCNTCGAFA